MFLPNETKQFKIKKDDKFNNWIFLDLSNLEDHNLVLNTKLEEDKDYYLLKVLLNNFKIEKRENCLVIKNNYIKKEIKKVLDAINSWLNNLKICHN